MDKKRDLFGIKDGMYFIITPLVLILPITYWYFTAPPPGWCEAQKRVLPGSEYFKFVTDARAYYKDQKVTNGKYSVLNCCFVYRVEGDFLSKIFRLDEGVWIDWRYERTQESRDEYDPNDKYFGVMEKIDSCATTVLESTGMTEN